MNTQEIIEEMQDEGKTDEEIRDHISQLVEALEE